ncbi:branched-chain amino acid ABC transporter [Marinobacterium aestuarii]|uniref:Branched-chain amino acid ABC transporter n=1 Tax=Marinobacterium aestuarii TaxID=1821621 RepID=A0A1A9F197_9GAMM|nr:AzlD domain-containing protein [Marinobacterium aestuarii]ANG63986.1 branched-chain amino acid ABC transporter [Marinobacterium aestuarii]
MSELELWLLFLAVGLGTFSLRLSFIQFHGQLRLPAVLNRALVYVPASVLAALVLPSVVNSGADAELSLLSPRTLAALAAALVAWKTKNILLTLGTGMGVLWLLQAFG